MRYLLPEFFPFYGRTPVCPQSRPVGFHVKDWIPLSQPPCQKPLIPLPIMAVTRLTTGDKHPIGPCPECLLDHRRLSHAAAVQGDRSDTRHSGQFTLPNTVRA